MFWGVICAVKLRELESPDSSQAGTSQIQYISRSARHGFKLKNLVERGQAYMPIAF